MWIQGAPLLCSSMCQGRVLSTGCLLGVSGGNSEHFNDRLLQAPEHRLVILVPSHSTVPGAQLVFNKPTHDGVLKGGTLCVGTALPTPLRQRFKL